MSDYLRYYVTDSGYQIVGPDGWPRAQEEAAAELESDSQPATLDVPAIDVEPVSVRDVEISREIES